MLEAKGDRREGIWEHSRIGGWEDGRMGGWGFSGIYVYILCVQYGVQSWFATGVDL